MATVLSTTTAKTITFPKPPTFVILKTKEESKSQTKFIDVWTVELPIKAANNTLIILKESIPSHDVDLQHLRRFAKPKNLPPHMQPPSRSSSVSSRSSASSSRSSSSHAVDSQTSQKSRSRSRSRVRRRRSSAASTMHLLICPVESIAHDELLTLLSNQSPFLEDSTIPKLTSTTVPSIAPMTPEQAQQWSAQYWPTVYRKMNPYGPHPTIVAREEQDLKSRSTIQEYMEMARVAGLETRENGTGVGAGCVVVERRDDGPDQIVAVAGDARFCGYEHGDADHTTSHNVSAHAVLRAIGMIARKRVRMASRAPTPTPDDDVERGIPAKPVSHVVEAPESVAASLLDYPLIDSEEEAFRRDNLIPSGYLCVKLEMYLTHEPCLMCSMAIVHSRFASCVFGQRMPKSGGFAADSGLGYGLFWRQELNWKLLCWECKMEGGTEEVELDGETQV